MAAKHYDDVAGRFSGYLNDESGVVRDGRAERIYFPSTEKELREIVQEASVASVPVSVSGGGTGVSGGRVPRGGWILATDEMRTLSSKDEDQASKQWLWTDPETRTQYEVRLKTTPAGSALLTVPVSITVKGIQDLGRECGWFYPPDPTERSAFIGGNIATNASGARSFKYGPTRNWIWGLRIVLPDGRPVELTRGDPPRSIGTGDTFSIPVDDDVIVIPRPSYPVPAVWKNVAGPLITDSSEPLDLFIGTEGIFGVVSEATLRLIRPPAAIVSLFAFCASREQALTCIERCRARRDRQDPPMPLSVEYLDAHSLEIMRRKETRIPETAESLVVLEQDAGSEEELYQALEYWGEMFEELDIRETEVAQTPAQLEEHKELRHVVPETINAIVRRHGQSKLGSDYSVPDASFRELFCYAFDLGREFEDHLRQGGDDGGPGSALWAHAGDSHLHLNLIPRTDEHTRFAKDLFLRLIKKTVSLGGSIAAEHGPGKKTLGGRPVLYYQYGDVGIEVIR